MNGTDDRVLLNIRRWKQRPSECAIAAAASLANYFDKSVTYSKARRLVSKDVLQQKEGLYTSQQARLLNDMGFGKITIVSCDPLLVDVSWKNLSKQKLIEKLLRKKAFYTHGSAADEDNKTYVNDMVKWLQYEDCDNNLVIDYNFPMYIRRHLDAGRPVGATFNWTKVFRPRKKGNRDLFSQPEEHAIVIRGYDDNGVFIVDSHHRSYHGRLSRFHNGYYKMPWAKYLVTAPDGDLLLVY